NSSQYLAGCLPADAGRRPRRFHSVDRAGNDYGSGPYVFPVGVDEGPSGARAGGWFDDCGAGQGWDNPGAGPMTQDADLARVLEAAPALAANHYGHTYLGMGNEVRRCTQPLVPTRRPSTSTGGLMSRASEHTCHAMACDAHVPPKMFMCKRHWYMLPKVMRNAVWEEYVFGQEDRM